MKVKKQSKVSRKAIAPVAGAICSAAETQAVVSAVMSVNKNGSEKKVLIGSRVADQNSEAAKKRNYLLDDWNGGAFTVQRNNFKHKSLSSWSANPVVGCMHACPHCYVSEIVLKQKAKLAEFGVQDPDGEWGDYAFLRVWHEEKFLAALKRAEAIPSKDLNADGNRAVMYSTTTDAYQTFRYGNADFRDEKNAQLKTMRRRSLQLIRDESTLNVRILTRSPLARQDFDLYKSFGNRLMFGMSVPTLDNDLSKAYEPHSPAPTQRLATLKAAKDQGLNVFVAIAPLFPDCDDEDIRRTLQAVKDLGVMTIFVEPINIRADNVERIAAIGRQYGKNLKLDVFDSLERWREYAYDQLKLVQRIARELGIAK